MKIKRFFAPDMRQAIRLVREEQGPDAVILSSRRTDGGVEIISAVDFDQDLIAEMAGTPAQPSAGSARSTGPARTTSPARPSASPARAAASPARPAPSAARPSAPAPRREAAPEPAYEPMIAAPAPAPSLPPEVVWSQDPAIVAMREELQSMRSLLQDQLSQLAWGDLARRQPVKADVIRRLGKLGLSTAVAREVGAHISANADAEQAWREALYALAQRIRICEDDLINNGGRVALVGPTGVGKTTTIAKLAARFALRHGRQHVALISADAYRIGAQKQLLTFGQILGVEVHNAASPEELGARLESLLDKKLVLIDTAGMGQRDMRLNEQIAALSRLPLIKTYLVAAATAQYAVLDEVVRAFGRVRLDGCVLTKLDEAASLGDALSMIIGTGLPVAYVSDGQRVPEDLQPARVSRLISRAATLANAREKVTARAHKGTHRGEGAAHAHV